jgi:serine/threonine protein kinase
MPLRSQQKLQEFSRSLRFAILALAMTPPDRTQTVDPREHVLAARQLDALGPYRLIEIIGEGGMGAVYRAEQTQPVRREVAIKVIRVDLGSVGRLARFEAERQILATLSHPNIAKVFDAGETAEGFPYLVMEYIEGAPIDDYCDRERLDIARRIRLVIDACDALTHAHQHGVIHRDVKPGNLLVDVGSGRPITKLIDFGIARLVERSDAALTETGRSVGTPQYMSPEQSRADPDIDIRTDVYALGMTLYRLLAGQLPHEHRTVSGERSNSAEALLRPSRCIAGSDEAELIAASFGLSRRELVQTLARDLDWIVLRATDPDRNRRYASVAALADDLRRYLRGFPVEAAPPSALDVTRKFVARHRVESIAALLLVVAVAAAFGFVLNAWQREREARALADARLRQHETFNAFVAEVIARNARKYGDAPVSTPDAIATAEQLLEERDDDPAMRFALRALLASVRESHRRGLDARAAAPPATSEDAH